MGKNLVIVESPAKAKTIGKILGADYTVKSSVGHVRDLPQRTLGVDIEHEFEPKYVLAPNKAKVVDELRKAARECEAVFLAPDPDREGEAIAWHLHEVLAAAAKGKPFFRVQYNEITPRAVRAAFEHTGEIDMARVDAQQARRVIDRIVGYTVSPMLWRRIKRGLSAGRVQSVALRLVCERERQIQAFRPEEYWVLGASLSKSGEPGEQFTVKLVRVDGEKPAVGSGTQAAALLEDLRGRELRVAEVRRRTVTRRPLPPFITSTLQQAASSVLGFSPHRTMSLAQKLYEGLDLGQGGPVGLITYMRTDAPSVSRDAQEAARAFLLEQYGAEYCPDTPPVYRSRANAQEAHEAVRPTDVTRTPASLAKQLSPPELKLYDLIWRRFLASQMTAARIDQRTVLVDSLPPPAQQHRYQFSATSSEIAFPGFLKIMAIDIRKSLDNGSGKEENGGAEDDSDEIEKLPQVSEGEALDLVKWLSERKETKPPARYSEAALVRALEANGVGRPSTYAAIIETLAQRDYVKREKRNLAPTALGHQVNDLLVDKLGALFDVGFTASMESSLDEVEEGRVAWRKLMADFYARFSGWMENAREPAADREKVQAVLGELQQVSAWAPALKRGRRTFDDAKFVASVAEQLEGGGRPVSERQLDTLVKMALRYREQIPGVTERMRGLGFDELANAEKTQPPRPETAAKCETLRGIELSEDQRRFVGSLEQQTLTGRRLSPAQAAALDRILIANARQIPDFEKVCASLGIVAAPEALEPDHESPALLAALGKVTQWREATKRGKRVFDDKAFYESVAAQFARKGALSPRQRAAMRKLIFRYREQMGDFEQLKVTLGLQHAPEDKPRKTDEP
ncbi:MAG: type I DNA topoisomerase [Kiritimatiellae bacterium]|nr:type I DNA topoisomerase [Kiritimatiellia bacterium]